MCFSCLRAKFSLRVIVNSRVVCVGGNLYPNGLGVIHLINPFHPPCRTPSPAAHDDDAEKARVIVEEGMVEAFRVASMTAASLIFEFF
jgi:hypothetical protein